MDNKPWHVLHVIANHENRVARHLTGRSMEHYLPVYLERSRWTDRTVSVERPLFPGYVFVRFPPQSRLLVVSTPSVLRILGDTVSETVDCADIHRIRESLASGYALKPHAGLTAGTRVRICRGIFNDTMGIVTDLRRNCTVVVSLSAANHSFSLDVELGDIEIVKDALSCVVERPISPTQRRSGSLYRAPDNA